MHLYPVLRSVTLLTATLLWGSCGESASSAKCSAVCKAPASGPCATADEVACRSTCNAMTSGLSTTCVQCITENSGWTGLECTCIGKPCTICGFGPGDNACMSPGKDEECTAAREKCSEFELYKATGSKCAALCGAGKDGGTSKTNTKNDSGSSGSKVTADH
jgi:hypothetical protein